MQPDLQACARAALTVNGVLPVPSLCWAPALLLAGALPQHCRACAEPAPACGAQTYNNVLHVYGLHWAREPALPLGGALEGGAGALRRCDLYLQHSVVLEQVVAPTAAPCGIYIEVE